MRVTVIYLTISGRIIPPSFIWQGYHHGTSSFDTFTGIEAQGKKSLFASITEKEGFGYQFEKIRNAVAVLNESNVHAATQLGLDILEQKYGEFEQELDAAGELADWAYDLTTYRHAIEVLRGYFTGNRRGLTERDARIYYHYLETEHEQFCAIAQEIDAESKSNNKTS
jgi:hypothetical protein